QVDGLPGGHLGEHEPLEARDDHVAAAEGHLVGVDEGVDGRPPDPADLLPLVGLGGVDALGLDGVLFPDRPIDGVQPPAGGGQLLVPAVLCRRHVMIIPTPDKKVKRILARLGRSGRGLTLNRGTCRVVPMMNNDTTNLPEDVRDAIAAADAAMTWEANVARAYQATPTARLRAQLDEARLASERA